MAADGDGGPVLGRDEGWGGAANRFSLDSEPPHAKLQMFTTSSSSVLDGDQSPYGSGGKTRFFRKGGKRTVPYDRPAVGRHAAPGPQAAAIMGVTAAQALADKRRGSGWAKPSIRFGISKMISSGATYLYSSIFRRQLRAPLEASLANPQNEMLQLDSDEPSSFPVEDIDGHQVENGLMDLAENIERKEEEGPNTSLSDVERLFRQKTLSRDEFEHLRILLLSRVVNNGSEKNQQPKHKHVEFKEEASLQPSQPLNANQSEAQRWRQDLQKSRTERENGIQTLAVYGNGDLASSNLAGATESLDALSSSPIEVAIAFMGGRTSGPTSTSPGEPLHQRDENILSSGPTPPNRQTHSSSGKLAGQPTVNEDQYFTPPPNFRQWGPNRVVSRTPYSRPLPFLSPREGAIDGTFGTPSATRWTPIRTPVLGGREMLKRRSTVLDDVWTSGGPIRRTRHKAITSATPSSLNQSVSITPTSLSKPRPFPTTPLSNSSLLTLPSPVSRVQRKDAMSRSVGFSVNRESTGGYMSSSLYVPAQSSETARKILETLEKMTPSPKGKSLGDELAIVRDKPPTILTEGMLNERARKTLIDIDHSSPSDVREPGPSGRSMDNESSSFGFPGSSSMSLEASLKIKGKGKATLPSTEKGSGVMDVLQSPPERNSIIEAPDKQASLKVMEVAAVPIPEPDKQKGFWMSANFEESGSEDEGRQVKTSISVSMPPRVMLKPPSSLPVDKPLQNLIFGSPSLSLPASTGVGSFGIPGIPSPISETSRLLSSGFTFPTRGLVEGPPTPKAMLPPSSQATPFFGFGQGLETSIVSGSAADQKNIVAKEGLQMETKAELITSSSSPTTMAQPVPGFLPSSNSNVSNISNAFKQNSPLFGASSSSGIPSSTVVSVGAASSSLTASGPASTVFKFGDAFPASSSSGTLSVGGAVSNTTPVLASSTNPVFGSGSSTVQAGPVKAPPSTVIGSKNLFSASPVSTSLPSSNEPVLSSQFSLGTTLFGQVESSPFKNLSTTARTVSSDSQASAGIDSSTPLFSSERPQKRSASTTFLEDASKRKSSGGMPSHTFTTFGLDVGNSVTPAVPVTFSEITASSQAPFPVSFGQDSPSQLTSALPANTSLFTFGRVTSNSGTPAVSSSSTFNSNIASFPAYSGSVFGTTSSGSTFGATSTSSLNFGVSSTPPAFGTPNATASFGGFTPESVSQSPPTAIFGTGFTSPSPSTTQPFAFGASPPSFSFGAGSASSTGPAFNFGSSGSFPFGANKSDPSAPQSSIFGLSSSVSTFGATTNGTMSGDVLVQDQSNMDDNSMAEETPQAVGSALPQPSIFGAQQSAAGAGSFVFGAQTGATGGVVSPLFPTFQPQINSGFPGATIPFSVSQAAPGGSLDFSGGSFALGAGGDRPTRKYIKAKRTVKRGK